MRRVLKFRGTEVQDTTHQWIPQYYLFIGSLNKFNISENKKILIISFWDNPLSRHFWFYAHSAKSSKWLNRVIFVRMGTPYFQTIGDEYIFLTISSHLSLESWCSPLSFGILYSNIHNIHRAQWPHNVRCLYNIVLLLDCFQVMQFDMSHGAADQ